MDPIIAARVAEMNPWLADPRAWADEVGRRIPERWVSRNVDREGLLDVRHATLIVGPRQAGKSTFVWTLLSSWRPIEVMVLNAEDLLVREWCRSAIGMITDVTSGFPGVRILFLEEAQHLDEAGLLVKGLVDARRDLRIVVTGSSAYDLAAHTRESLAGRAVRRRLLPLSHGELSSFEVPDAPALRTLREREIRDRQLQFGSYPAVWFDPHPTRALSNLVEAFVIRDASDRFHIQRPDAFRAVLRLAAGQVGQMVNLSEWAAAVGVASTTIADWLALLEEAWILKLVPAFAGGKRREITSARRVHFFDLGVRNSLILAFSPDLAGRPDRGALLEGWAFAELMKALPADATLHYWRAKGGAEVDLVAVRGDVVLPIEIKGRDPGRISRSLKSFIDSYSPRTAIVACGEAERRDEMSGSCTVAFVPLEKLPTCAQAALST